MLPSDRARPPCEPVRSKSRRQGCSGKISGRLSGPPGASRGSRRSSRPDARRPLRQRGDQGLRVAKVWGVEPLRECRMHPPDQLEGFRRPFVGPPISGQAHGCAELERSPTVAWTLGWSCSVNARQRFETGKLSNSTGHIAEPHSPRHRARRASPKVIEDPDGNKMRWCTQVLTRDTPVTGERQQS